VRLRRKVVGLGDELDVAEQRAAHRAGLIGDIAGVRFGRSSILVVELDLDIDAPIRRGKKIDAHFAQCLR